MIYSYMNTANERSTFSTQIVQRSTSIVSCCVVCCFFYFFFYFTSTGNLTLRNNNNQTSNLTKFVSMHNSNFYCFENDFVCWLLIFFFSLFKRRIDFFAAFECFYRFNKRKYKSHQYPYYFLNVCSRI